MKKILVLGAALVALFGANDLQAQASQTVRNATASITIPQVLFLDVQGTNITFPSPAIEDFDAGKIATSVQSVISHRGNVPHSVQISADSEFMTAGLSENANLKPSTDLRWARGASAFSGLSTSAADIISNSPRGAFQNAATISYEMNLDYENDSPDTYTLPFRFTIIAN